MRRIPFFNILCPSDRIGGSITRFLNGEIDKNVACEIALFEKEVADYLGVKHCISVNSGTTGLLLALRALDLKGEVIVPSFTFSATVNAFRWNGLMPRFSDIDRGSLNIDLRQVKKNITRKTSAILAVNMFGNPADIEELDDLARERKLRIIFDSAHAYGSEFDGKKLGNFGDMEIFSFQSQKLLSTIEGGAITTNDSSLASKLLLMRSQGNRGDGNCLYLGLNARIHPLAAIIGRARLKSVAKSLIIRKRLAELYFSLLSNDEQIRFQCLNAKGRWNYQYMPILIDKAKGGVSRDQLAAFLKEKGVETRKYFSPPVHRFRAYADIAVSHNLPNTNYVSRSVLCLPLYESLPENQIKYICAAINRSIIR